MSRDQYSQIKQTYLAKYPQFKETLHKLFPDSEVSTPSALTDSNTKALLEQFGQVILYGPPGTGKTREAKRAALALLSGREPSSTATSKDIEEQLTTFRAENRFDLVVFHPAYEYEQFVGGIEPKVEGDKLAFHVKEKVFLRLCRAATNEKPGGNVVLIIDEINRGNLPKLLGELVYALEKDYRGHEVTLPFVRPDDHERSVLVIPNNLYIIATMNSSDRSIGHIDVAIRRRFALVHIGPNPDIVRLEWRSQVKDEAFGNQLANLMERVNKALNNGDDQSAEVEFAVGHSYFLPAPNSSPESAKQQVRMKWTHQVQPLLREYAQLLNLSSESLRLFIAPLDQVLATP